VDVRNDKDSAQEEENRKERTTGNFSKPRLQQLKLTQGIYHGTYFFITSSLDDSY
jgi:hypothetical protein